MGHAKEEFMEMRQQDVASSLELNSLMRVNKEGIKDRVQIALDNIQDGNLDALEVLIFAKKGKELFDVLEKNVRPIAESKHVPKGYAAYDCTVIEKNSPESFDFTVCNDSTWNDLKAKEVQIKIDLKKREDFLKTLTEPMAPASTGEVINPPSVTHGRITLALTLK